MPSKRNRKGRSRPSEHFARLTRSIMEEPAWGAMPTRAQALYPWLMLEWRGQDHNNNGKVRLSVRQAAQKMGVSTNTAAAAFHDLQAKGFIVVREKAVLGLEGHAKSPAYELTDFPMPGIVPQVGRKLFREWREGKDFEVVTHTANNPTGLNGKSRNPSQKARRSRLKNDDEKPNAVSEKRTGCLKSRDVSDDSKTTNVIDFETSLSTIPKDLNAPPVLNLKTDLALCPLLANS